MINRLSCVLALLCAASTASATTITFSEVAMPSNGDSTPAATNQWAAYGITMSNLYYYTDLRDTFDHRGIAVLIDDHPRGTPVPNNPGIIQFTAPVEHLSIDYGTIGSHVGRFAIFDSSNVLLDSIDVANAGDFMGSYNFHGSHIARLEISGEPTYDIVSTLRFDTTPVLAVGEPAPVLLLALALVALRLCSAPQRRLLM